jgi:hypothetical protein
MCEEKTREGAADTGSASVVVGQDRSRTGGGAGILPQMGATAIFNMYF